MECPRRGHEGEYQFGFICPTGGPGYAAASTARETAFEKPAVQIGAGGPIPLLHVLRQAAPEAEFILWGA
jgi:hypothetical protein